MNISKEPKKTNQNKKSNIQYIEKGRGTRN